MLVVLDRLNAGAGAPETRESSSRPSNSAKAAASSPLNAVGDQGPDAPGKRIAMFVCLIFNLGLALMVACNGVLAVGHKSNSDDAGVIFVGIYMIIFASILILYEMIQICPMEQVDLLYKRNFGFLYGTFGKCFYFLL